jgi:hypothetical protein
VSTRYDAKIGDDITLEATFSIEGVPTDVYKVIRVDLVDSSLRIVATRSGNLVTNIGIGKYSVTFPDITVSGTLKDHWVYVPVLGAVTKSVAFSVNVAGFSGESGDSGGDAPDPTLLNYPDVPISKVCKVTHQFIDGGGKYFQGVYVRFRPHMSPVQSIGMATAARQTTVVSDVEGKITLFLLKGITGTLAISGVGLTREVTIPNVGEIDLMDLISTAPDLLEVQTLELLEVPRRTL